MGDDFVYGGGSASDGYDLGKGESLRTGVQPVEKYDKTTVVRQWGYGS